jgi:hypothetical protein
MIDNNYTIGKIRRLFDSLNSDLKEKMINIINKAAELDLNFGEPFCNSITKKYSKRKENEADRIGAYAGKNKNTMTIFLEENIITVDYGNDWNKTGEIKKYNYDELERVLCDMVEWQNKPGAIYTLEEKLEIFDTVSTYKKDWNSYCCNPINPIAIKKCKEMFLELYHKHSDTLKMSAYALADGGNSYKRPPEDSTSAMAINLKNSNKRVEIEFWDDRIEYLGSYKIWNPNKNCHDLHFPISTNVIDLDDYVYNNEDLYDLIEWLINEDIPLDFNEHEKYYKLQKQNKN